MNHMNLYINTKMAILFSIKGMEYIYILQIKKTIYVEDEINNIFETNDYKILVITEKALLYIVSICNPNTYEKKI